MSSRHRRRNAFNRSNSENWRQSQMICVAEQDANEARTHLFKPCDYPLITLKGLQSLRNNQKFCDVIISVNGKRFNCHRVVLASVSPYFETMFSSGLVEEKQHTVEIHGIVVQVFDLLIDFIYSGEISITQDNVQDLLAAANMLELTCIVTACCDFLRSELHPSNCIGIYRFAELHSCTNLRLEAKRYIERFFTEVIQEDEFYELPKEMIKGFLRSEGLSIDNEHQVFQATMKWILSDVTQRRKYVFELLEHIRLPVISERQLDLYVQECSDLSLKVALMKVLQDHKTEMKLLQLEKQTTFVHGIRMQPRMCARKSVYVIGGYNWDSRRRWIESHNTLKTVECLDTYRCQWKTLPCMRFPRSGFGLAVLNSMIYVIGGESNSMISDSGESFDPISNEWSKISSMSRTRSVLGACALDGYIYALGGWVGAEIGDTIERYDPTTDTWTPAGKMSVARYSMGVVAHEGLIYVIGGLSDIGRELSLVESHNPVTGEWNVLAPLRTRRAHVGVAVLHDHLYAVGGSNDTVSALRTVERYSIDEDKWTEIPPMRTARAGASVAAVNGKLLVLGGRLGNQEFLAPMALHSVEVYDPETNTWSEASPMPTSRCESGVAVL